jgi:hypothetical protein
MPLLTFSEAGLVVSPEVSHRSGLKVEASGPKWSTSRDSQHDSWHLEEQYPYRGLPLVH